MKTDDTRQGSWYEQKMIPAANGKEYGPYWYLRRRDGIHTRSTYIGKRLRLIGDAGADIRPLDPEAATDAHPKSHRKSHRKETIP